MKLQVVLVLAILSFIVADKNAVQVYCGRRLAQTLGYLCSSDYMVKRSGYPAPFGFHTGLEPDFEPWLTPARAQGLRGGRGKRQVADECCLKPCSMDELLSYC